MADMTLMTKRNGTCCCGDEVNSCLDWTGTPPAQLQLTLPATCERAGTHVLTSVAESYASDCPRSSRDDLSYATCETWKLHLGTGAAEDTIYVSVLRSTTNGDTIIVAAVCNEGGGGLVDAGNLWADTASITDWGDLDGISLPWTNQVTDNEGMADCTGSPPDNAVISFVP